MRVGLKPTLMVQVPAATAAAVSSAGVVGSSATAALAAASVLLGQSWLTTEKSSRGRVAAVVGVGRERRVALVKTSGASPTLVIVTGVALLAAAVPAATDVNCGVRANATGAGSPVRAAKLLSAEVNGLKPPLLPGVTGSYS